MIRLWVLFGPGHSHRCRKWFPPTQGDASQGFTFSGKKVIVPLDFALLRLTQNFIRPWRLLPFFACRATPDGAWH